MAVAKFLRSPVGHSRGEAIGTSAVMGVGVGMTNATLNQHYVSKGKSKYRAHKMRRIEGAHGLQRKGGK